MADSRKTMQIVSKKEGKVNQMMSTTWCPKPGYKYMTPATFFSRGLLSNVFVHGGPGNMLKKSVLGPYEDQGQAGCCGM